MNKYAEDFELPALPGWLERQTYLERYVNDGSPNRMSFVKAPSPALSPRLAPDSVAIPLIRTARSELSPMGREASSKLVEFCLEQGCFPVHPDALGYYFNDSREFEIRSWVQAVPSSSGRTLLIWDGADFKWLKLSYPGYLGRFRSPLDRRKVAHSLEASRVLSVAAAPLHLSEPVGMTMSFPPGTSSSHTSAFILRSSKPQGFDEEKHKIVPLFSLIAAESDAHEDVLGSMPGGCRSRAESVFSSLIKPILESYWRAALKVGLIPEAHAQNVLVQTGEGGNRIVFRDMQGFVADPEYCGRQGDRIFTLSSASLLRERSRRYDDYLSRYIMLPLITALQERHRFSWDRIFQLIRECTGQVAEAGYFENEFEWYEMPYDQVQFERRIEYRKRHGKPLFR